MEIEALKEQLKAASEPTERLRIVKLLGVALAAAGNAPESRRAWEAAFKFAPQDLEVVHALRLAVVAGGDHRGALEWFQREAALTTQDQARAWLFRDLGEHFQDRLSDLDNAQKAFARARQLDANVFAPRPDPALADLDLPPPPAAAAPEPVAPPPIAPTPVVARPRPSAPLPAPRAQARSSPGSRKWLSVGAGVLVLGGVGFFARDQFKPAAAPAGTPRFECAGELTRLPDEEDEGTVSVYECSTPLLSRRWRLRGERVVEFALFSRGQREGEIVLTPQPDERIVGAYAGNEKTGAWKTYKNGALALEEEWVAGKRNGAFRVYQADGGLLELQEWALNEKNGAFAVWNRAGVKTQEGQYQRGARTGVWATYDAKGVLERWLEPRRLTDAGVLAEAGPIMVDELYAGQTLRWWKIRYAEVSLNAKANPALEPFRALTLQRANLAGLRLSPTSGLLEVDQ